MKKLLFIVAIALLGTNVSNGQQLAQYSQYLMNPYILNPATTGMYDYMDVNLSFRKQWAGFDASPQTMYASAHGPLKKKPPIKPLHLRMSQPSIFSVQGEEAKRGIRHGLGGSLVSDEYGAFTNNTVNLSYAIHLPIKKTWWLSFGLGGGISMLSFDQSKVTLATSQLDQTYSDFIGTGSLRLVPDIKGGLYLYNDRFCFGYTSNQILQSQVYFGGAATDANLELHHFANIGYTIIDGEKFRLTPGALLKFMGPAPMSIDINMKAEFGDMFWLGASYRTDDAIVGMLGVTLSDLIRIGYSFDYTVTDLSTYNSGSHEIMLGIMLFK